MKKIAVTGGTGSWDRGLGPVVIAALEAKGYEVTNIDRALAPGQIERWGFIRADLTDYGQTFAALHGHDAVIQGELFGTEGGARFHNVNGSFYDFAAEHMRRTGREQLITPPDAWGGRAAAHWARRLMESRAYDEGASEFLTVAQVLDGIVQAS